MKLIFKNYKTKERKIFNELLKIEIEQNLFEETPKPRGYLVSLYNGTGYLQTLSLKTEGQEIDLYEEIDKQAEAINKAIKRERQGIKALADEMAWNYEASASGTDNAQLKEIYLMKAQGLRDFIEEMNQEEQLEAELIGSASDYESGDLGTETANEIKRQNGEG